MATVNHLGLFPKAVLCPQPEPEFNDASVDIWISSGTPFLYACAHYWKVKTWRVSASATWEEIGGEGATTFSASFSDTISQGINRTLITYSDGFEEDVSSGETPSSENQLVCNDPNVEHALSRGKDTEVGGSRLSALYRYDTSPPAYFRLGGGSVSHVNTNFAFTASTIRWEIRAHPFVGNLGTYGSLTYSLLDQSFTAPLYASNSSSSLPEFSNTLSISASIEAEEYWPYES
jgi:hypothetical protein